MTHTPNELTAEFPDQISELHELKLSDRHFVRLADEYHFINREIHRIEVGVEPAADQVLFDLKKARLHLKDQIGEILAKV